MMAFIKVPMKSFADEPIVIEICGLGVKQKITIQAQEESERGQLFHSYAHYTANENGVVKIDTDPSFGGSYVGVEQMGLFWSMKRPSHVGKSFATLSKMNVTTPAEVTLSVFEEHIEETKIWSERAIYVTKIERWHSNDENVDRIPIVTENITGTLFVPRCPGMFPGVLDIVGSLGGILEHRAALLANHGFAALALGFFNCENRPNDVKYSGDLDYVAEAVKFLLAHDKVLKAGIAILGLSLGGTIAVASAAVCPGVRCVINIGGPVFGCLGIDITSKNRTWKAVEVHTDAIIIDDGIEDYFDTHQVPSAEDQALHMPNFYESKAEFLLLYPEDDRLFNTDKIIKLAETMFKKAKNKNYKIIKYSGAGHVLLPPYQPLIRYNYIPIGNLNSPCDCGGDVRQHAYAQVKVWKAILKFLENSLK